MGTSSLYGGPKKTALLPSDYNPDDMAEQDDSTNTNSDDTDTSSDNTDDNKPNQEQTDVDSSSDYQLTHPVQPKVSWGSARGSMKKAMNERSERNVKRAIRNYTKALGGHTNATRQSAKVRKTAFDIYSYFSGTPNVIRKRLEDAGVRFEGRATKDIFNDICRLIAPVPNDLEDSLANMALQETIADVATDDSIDLNLLESFNEELLQRLVGGLMKHYIFDKLIMQSEQTALKNCERTSTLRELEKEIKLYIDGIVDGVVPNLMKSGMNPKDFNRALETLFDISYQQMEELK